MVAYTGSRHNTKNASIARKLAAMLKQAIIKHEGGKWVLRTSDGKRVLGTHTSAEAAYKQEYAIQMSKRRAGT